jgi:hypothetical protein
MHNGGWAALYLEWTIRDPDGAVTKGSHLESDKEEGVLNPKSAVTFPVDGVSISRLRRLEKRIFLMKLDLFGRRMTDSRRSK